MNIVFFLSQVEIQGVRHANAYGANLWGGGIHFIFG